MNANTSCIDTVLLMTWQENDFVNFMRDPLSPSPTLPPATQPQPQTNPGEDWADIEGQKNINFLTAETFDSFIAEQPSVLVMFYAPCEFLW